MTEHLQVCEMLQRQCAAKNCTFVGLKADLLEHVVAAHEGDILIITQKLAKTHLFQPDMTDIAVQTEPAIIVPQNIALLQYFDGGVVEMQFSCIDCKEKRIHHCALEMEW